MKVYLARSAKKLDLCLRLLHYEGIEFTVKVVETEKRKIAYEISIDVDD